MEAEIGSPQCGRGSNKVVMNTTKDPTTIEEMHAASHASSLKSSLLSLVRKMITRVP